MTNRERILRNVVNVLKTHNYTIKFGDELITSLHTHDTITASVEAGAYDKCGEIYCWGINCEVKLVFVNDNPRMLSFQLLDSDSNSILDEAMLVAELGFIEELDQTLTLKGLPF